MQTTELTPKQQVVELLRQAESVLIVTGREPSVDQVASVYALQTVLGRLGKKSHAVISDSLAATQEIIDTSHISASLDGVRDFIVSLDLAAVEVDKLKYDIVDNHLDITITPLSGNFTPESAAFKYGSFQFDLVVVLGVHRIVEIDRILEQNPTLFDGLHLINLDYHRVNEGYGSVNYIDTAATAVSEMLIGVIESLGQGMIDADLATALLAGLISSTNRFTTAATTPKAMTMAAQLMSGGARQQGIIKALYSGSDQPRRSDRPGKSSEASKPKTVAQTLPPEALAELQAVAARMQAETAVSSDIQPVEYLPQNDVPAPVTPIMQQSSY